MKVILRMALVNVVFVVVGLCLYVAFAEINLYAKTEALLNINYYFVAVAKIITMIPNRKRILEAFNEFHETHPGKCILENAYIYQMHEKKYKLIEKVVVKFFWSAMIFYCFQALTVSFIDLVMKGTFTFNLPWMMVWYGIEFPKENVPYYVFMYISQTWSIYVAASISLAMDLCIYSSIIQLNMRLDIICKNIINIEPDETNKAFKELQKEISAHQRFIRLAEKLNIVFTPSVLFSLLSSSLIICFTGFQLLGELSLFIVVKAIFLLAYELKQVAITCFLGDKLIEISLKISDAIYEHKWYNGTPKYRRLVLMVLMRSQHSVALHIAGISDISLQTFRQVMSISYQIFTVLRTG
ncbi:putative odorant receptor 92a [Episyrphus balteatus]|uniref:putative odorant receptor 92a n=1 Tax=Episyrphus balteatus TaxID=286459 RepID=UPI002486CBF2|nr:putative odorant receptor 92a [Episyrphus balteatus]